MHTPTSHMQLTYAHTSKRHVGTGSLNPPDTISLSPSLLARWLSIYLAGWRESRPHIPPVLRNVKMRLPTRVQKIYTEWPLFTGS